ncbi:MAG: RNA-binding protein [Ramlibacter sp.]|nr:RNA-binding protein [Ramlibacter sp.]
MSNKLYVGNLSYSVRDEDLQQQFSAFGSVHSAKVIMDRDTGGSKGFAFVEMSSPAEAEAAIQGLNGKNFGGRDLTVNIARPTEARSPRGSGGGFGGGRRSY